MSIDPVPTPPRHDKRLYLLALGSLTAVQMLSTIAFNAGPVLAPAAAADLGVQPDDVAYFVSIVYVVSIGTAMAGGAMSLRLGPIRLSQLAMLVSAAGCAALAAGSLWLAILAAMLIGLGGGPMTAASSQILAHVTPPRLSNITFSIKQSGVPLAFALAGALIPPLVTIWGWQAASWAIAVLCVVTALAIEPLRPLYDTSRDSRLPLVPSLARILEPLGMAWRDPVLRPLCLAGMCFSSLQATIVGFTLLYAGADLGMDYVTAGILLAVATSAGMVGRVLWGAVADVVRRPLGTLALLGAIMTAGSFAFALAEPGWPRWLLYGVAAILGGTAIGWNGVFISECARRAPPGRAGEFVGATSFFVFVGPVLWPLIYRGLLYVTHAYPVGFVVLAVATGLSTLAILRLIGRGER